MADTILSLDYIVKTPGTLSGAPRIAGHRIGVHHIAMMYAHLDVPAAQIANDYDLSLAEVHAALAYYYANRDEIEAILAENEQIAGKYDDNERMKVLRNEISARVANKTKPNE
jgi:uncharacterized protein (DUF433 family)